MLSMSCCLYNKKNITRRLEDVNLFSRGKKNIVLPHENKIHIFAPPCSILYIFAGCGNVFMIRKVEYD